MLICECVNLSLIKIAKLLLQSISKTSSDLLAHSRLNRLLCALAIDFVDFGGELHLVVVLLPVDFVVGTISSALFSCGLMVEFIPLIGRIVNATVL